MDLLRRVCTSADGQLSLLHRLKTATFWADAAYTSAHPYALEAYRTSLQLAECAFVAYPICEVRHDYVLKETQSVATDAASCAIENKDLTIAVEMLEQGRALLWSHLRKLRPPLHMIESIDPHLRDDLLRVTQALQVFALSFDASTQDDDSPRTPGSAMLIDDVGARFKEHRKLVTELDTIISTLRKVPGMERFFLVPSYDMLRDVTSEGPVIIVNHSKHHSDALILLHGGSPTRVPLDRGFYQKVLEMTERLCQAQTYLGKKPKKYEKELREILADVWLLLGRPVRDALVSLGVDKGSRVWWCPTSAVSALPLHAAGPETIASEQGEAKRRKRYYFQDFYVSSYTPTLSALLEARKYASVGQAAAGRATQRNPPDKPSLLVIAHSGGNLEQVPKEVAIMRAIHRRFKRTKFLQGRDAKRESVMRELREHPWVHIACHGSLTPGEPFKSAFRLSEDDRLTLADIMGSRIPNAEFAFLSACHTAEQTQGSASEEVLQLAAAVQFCGYRSVIGTMWAMQDLDGPSLVANVYESMFAEAGYPDEMGFKRAARALHSATRQMRKDGAMLEQWVNFVHIGA
ncbi:uncharacterized protein PHACADRAFT_257596 [Phanerochaete carnosa HHB-10118-sp]|uniref:CHAT domain-containing protein n=1 Tax=Phanerochaete carnosa (strain HHB-10118-sp) TaxID=650164 RepID=K5VRB4_PHACS|nr:uncharacterized protein PHACADRAFT_257596 [Phanerochaete carnosa HHB-10118-sp]EKM54018.1 hypothetical protein PHACADRAFT_257596 [Phanerochaete carnosa HHB-10118-sp]